PTFFHHQILGLERWIIGAACQHAAMRDMLVAVFDLVVKAVRHRSLESNERTHAPPSAIGICNAPLFRCRMAVFNVADAGKLLCRAADAGRSHRHRFGPGPYARASVL